MFTAGLQLRGLGQVPGPPEEGTWRSQRLPVGGAVDVCLGQDEPLRAEMGPRGVHLCLGVFLLREWKERGQWQCEQPLFGKRGVQLLWRPCGRPPGEGCAVLGSPCRSSPRGPAPARLPVPLCFAQNQTPTDTCH